jgi:hypothetical protein
MDIRKQHQYRRLNRHFRAQMQCSLCSKSDQLVAAAIGEAGWCGW